MPQPAPHVVTHVTIPPHPAGLHSLRMTAYSRGMSTARQADRLNETEVLPAVPVRRSILHPTRPASQDEGATFADWRGQAVTEELPAVPPASTRRASPGTRARRHLRCALVGTLLAVVAVTGLSSYAAAGAGGARPTAPCQARVSCR